MSNSLHAENGNWAWLNEQRADIFGEGLHFLSKKTWKDQTIWISDTKLFKYRVKVYLVY